MTSRALKDIEKLEQRTVQLAVNGMVWIDKNGRIWHANDSACQMLKYSYRDLTRKTIFEIDPNVNPDNFEAKYLKTIRKKERYRFESVKICRTGRHIPVEVTVFHVQHGTMDLYCAFFFDISIRKQMTDKLIESETRMRALFNNHFQLTGLLDHKGRILMANKTSLDLVQAREEDVLGMLFWESPWFIHSKGLQNRVKDYVRKAAKGEMIRTEFELIDANGRTIIFDNSFKPIRDASGTVQFIVPESRDINDIRTTEQNLKNAYLELEALKNKLQDENLYLKEELLEKQKYTNLVGESEAFKNVLLQIEQVAETNATVLILGETGTGKELVVNTIHNLSNRSDRPLIKLNCAAIPASLIESELFGHEKGAFTGAHAQKVGRFELADNGTIFLDEIGELPIDLQAKLLRVLQESEFERIGGTRTINVDIRVIAATNRDMKEMIKDNTFREDLYYRLHVFPVHIPPLRDRIDDIELLANFLIKKINKRLGKNITAISQRGMKKLKGYYWPGNIRELENVLERAAVLCRKSTLDIGQWFQTREEHPDKAEEWISLEDHQREYIIKVLKKTRRRVRGAHGAAKLLDMNPSTLESRIRKLRINKYEI